MCWCRATTPKSAGGGSARRWRGPWRGGPIYWPTPVWTKKNKRSCASSWESAIKERVMGAIELVEKAQLTDRPPMKSGDTVRVHVKVREGDKERIQIFEGLVIGVHRGGTRASFTVRKVSFGQGVERIFPLHSPTIQKVEVLRAAKVRQAKLDYLRDLKGKAARMKDGTNKA